MPTFLFDEHVFGPIKSRRLGSSLGINLLSTEEKVCNFDCIYCECGFTEKLEHGKEAFVPFERFQNLLKDKLIDCTQKNVPIDAITFAGNGEPTLHPQFNAVVDVVISLRDQYYPDAKIVVLTNGFTLDKQEVKIALSKVDKAIFKLDAGNDDLFRRIDRPKGEFNTKRLIDHLLSFRGNVIIQSMFLKGKINGEAFDNSEESNVNDWVQLIELINPSEVMLYSLDRDTPMENLERINKERLMEIALLISNLGIKTQVV